MKVRFGFVLVLMTMSTWCYGQRYAVADGNWNNTSTWSTTEDGSPGASVPTSNDDVYTDGRLITISDFDTSPTCRNLYVSYNVGNSLSIGEESLLTITGTLVGWDFSLDQLAIPNTTVISFGPIAGIRFTGANVSSSPYSPDVIESWGGSSTLGRALFAFGTGNTYNIDSEIQVSSLARIESGTLVLNQGATIYGVSASLAVNSSNALELEGTAGPLSSINIFGSVSASATSFIDVAGLTINSSGTLSSLGTVNISGNLSNSGSLTLSTIIFDGSSQNITGNAFDLVNLTVASGATVTNNSNIDVTGTVTLQGTGSFDADGSGSGIFRLVSTSLTETGRIATLPDPNLFTGTVTVERFIDGPDNWRYLAMPISNGTVATWQSSGFPVTGNFSNPSPADADVVAPSAPSIYYWDATAQDWVAVGDGGNTSSIQLADTIGYSAWSYRTTGTTLSSTGPINKGNIQTTLGVGNGDFGPGWNLLPNPYPSQIDWDFVNIPAEMDAGISVQRTNGQFASYVAGCTPDPCPPNNPPTGNEDWTGEIAVGQSFWVSTESITPVVLTFNEDDKTDEDATFMRKSEPKYFFRVALSSANQQDQTTLWFGDQPTRNFDSKFDARKRQNLGHINLSSFTDDPEEDLAINGLPKISCIDIIGLRVRDVSAGNYSLTFTDLDKLYLGYTIKLIDHFTAQEMIAENNSKYDFAVTADPASYGSSRFELEISAPEINDEVSPSFTDLKECDDQSVKVKLTNAQAGVMYQLWSGGTAVSDLVTSEGEEVVLIIPKSNIQYGGNVLSLNAETVGQCSSHIFGDAINYVLAEEPEVSAVTAAQHCGPGTVTLSAEGAQANGLYKWYEDSDGTTLLQASDIPSFTTPELIKSKSYFVSVVNESGCESPLVPAEAAIVYVEKPVIAVDGMTLISSSASGNQWFKDGVALTGETAAVLEVTASGDYSVEVTENGCNALSDPLSFVVTDVSEQMRSGVRFYPNPIDDKLIVELPAELAPMVRRVAVYDAKGVEVMVEEDVTRIKSGTFELDFSEKKAGNYIMNILSDRAIIALRLIRK